MAVKSSFYMMKNPYDKKATMNSRLQASFSISNLTNVTRASNSLTLLTLVYVHV